MLECGAHGCARDATQEAGSRGPERAPRLASLRLGEAVAGATGSFTDRISAYDMRSNTRKTNSMPCRSSGSLIFGRLGSVWSIDDLPSRQSASTWPRSMPSRAPRLSETIWFCPAVSASP